MQQWEFGYITDNWGDVPYSQALAGDSTGGAVLPAVRSAEGHLHRHAREARRGIHGPRHAGLAVARRRRSDLRREPGGVAQVRQLAPRARRACGIVNVDPAKANAELTAAFAAPGGVFTSNADNAVLAWPGDGVFNNPWSDNFKTRDDHRMSKTFVDILTARSDPRVDVFAQPDGGLRGWQGRARRSTPDSPTGSPRPPARDVLHQHVASGRRLLSGRHRLRQLRRQRRRTRRRT